MAGVRGAADARIDGGRVGSSVVPWLVLALLVALLVLELVVLVRSEGSDHGLPDASLADVGAARSYVMATDFSAPAPPHQVVGAHIVAGPRLQRVSGGRATFLVVVDQTITSGASQPQPQLVHTGVLVTVQEKDHKIVSVRVL